MPYSVELPDGTLVSDIPDDMPPAEVQQRIYAAYPQFAPKQSTVLGELKRGAKQFVSSTQTGLEAITSPEEAAKAGVERAQRIAEEAGQGVSFEPVKEAYQREGLLAALGEAASQVPRAVAGMAPAAAATIAGGKAGAMAGTAAAPALGPFAPAGPIVGGLLGAGAALYGSMAGSNIERQAQEQLEAGKPVSIDRPAAYGAAAGQTALEAVGTGAVLGKRLVKSVLGIADDAVLATAQARQTLVKEAQRSLLGATGMGAVRGTAEIPVEIAQAVLERAQAGLDVLSPEAYAEYGDTAYQAALGGMGLGAITGVPSRGQARAELAQVQPPPAQAAQQEAQQRILAAREQERVKAEAETPFGVMGPYAQEQYGQLEQEKQQLLELPQAPNVQERVAEIIAQQKQLNVAEVTRLREEKAQQEGEAAKAAQSAFAQPEVRETPEGQGLLFSQFEAPEARVQPETVPAPTAPEPQPLAPSTMEKEGQRRLGLRGGKAGKGLYREEPLQIETGPAAEALPPVTEPVPEPTLAPKRVMPPELQPVVDKLSAAGVRPEVQTWAENARNRPFLRKLMGMADMAPQAIPEARKALKFKEGSEKAEIFDALFPTPGVPAFEPAAGAGESRLGLLGQLGITPSEAPAPRAGEPVGRGVVPAGRAASAPAKPEGRPAPALAPAAYPSLSRAEQYWNEIADAIGGKTKPFSELTPAQRGAWREAVQTDLAQTLRDEYTRLVAEKPEAPKYSAEEIKAARKKAVEAEVLENRRAERRAKEEGKEKPSLGGERTQQAQDFEQTLRTALNKFGLKDVGLKLVKGMQDEGSYAQQLIKIAADSANPIRTMRHEAIHALRELGFFTDAQWQSLSKMAKDEWIDQYLKQRNVDGKPLKAGEESRYDAYLREYDGNMEKITEEAVADAFADFDATKPPAGMVASLIAKLRNLFQAIKSALTKVESPEQIFGKVEKGELKEGAQEEGGEKKSLRDKATANFLRWFSDSKVVDKDGEPLVLYRGIVGYGELSEKALSAEPREGYATFASDNPAISSTYANPDWTYGGAKETGAIVPVFVKADKLIEFPVKTDASGRRTFDKVEFDRRAKGLAPGEVLVARGVTDTGPRASLKADPERRWSYPSDIYAWNSGTSVKSATGNNGEYSLTDADIRKSLRAPSPTEGIAAQSELMKDAPKSLVKTLGDAVRIFMEKDDVPFITRFRTEAADVAASVVNRLNILFDGKVRDELTGLTNPELLIRQAQASEALFSGFLASGGIEKDATTGQYVVTDKAGPGGSVADMLTAIKNWSDAKGMDFKLGYAEASKMLEARRLDAMRQANVERKQKGQDLFPIHKLAIEDKARTADEQIDAALRGLKANPEIAEVADNMDKQRGYMIDKMVAVGRISKDTAQEWKDAAGYVPFDRVEDFFDKYIPKRTSGRGLAQLGSLPQFVGTTQREVGNVFDNHTKLMGWMLKQTLKQDATATTLNVLADIGQAKRLGGNKAAASNPNNVVKSYKNGKEEYFEVRSHWDAVAFRDAPEVKGTLVKLFAQVSNILRKIVTVMPPFVAKQVTDDIQRAFITSGVRSPSRLVVPAITNFLRIAGHEVVFGKSHPFTKEFAKKGLVGDIDYNASNPAETVLFNMGYSKRGWLSELHHRLESITRASDLAMRKAIYDRTMAEENEDVGLATARAREFINFRRRGASKTVGTAIATIPFFNAYLQSNDLLYRSMIGRGSSITERAVAKRLFWTQAAKMTTFALIYALANSDDEEYDKLSFEEKANNWVVDGKKLPAPGDMAALFKVPVEALVHYMSRQGTEEEQLTNEVVKQVLGYTYEQFVGRVTPVPQAIRPVAEALTNYSFLTMRPLVGTYQRGLPEEFQTVSTTSELAKAIAKFSHNNIVDPLTDTPLDLSPIVIDNTLRGYLGGVVPLMNMLIDQMVNPNKTDRPLSKYWFVGQYLTPEVPSGPKDEFYDLVNKVMPVKRALDKLASTDIDAAMKYYEKNADKLKMAEMVNSALQIVRQTRQYINWLDSENGAKEIESGAERLKLKQEAERYLNEQLSWVRAAKARIFGKAE